jgi:hypothetical protein
METASSGAKIWVFLRAERSAAVLGGFTRAKKRNA